MGLFNFVSILGFLFTTILFLFNKKIGKTYIYIGCLTLFLVLLYGYFPAIDQSINKIPLFLIFSLIIILMSNMMGLIAYFITKKNKISVVISVVISILMILVLFNKKGMISYLFIPVLMVKLQEYLNNTVIISEKNITENKELKNK